MGGRARLLLAVAGLVLAGAATADDAGRAGTSEAVARCGHLEELEAAKRAAALGDREEVLLHLRKADELLARCMRDGSPAAPPAHSAPRHVEAG